MLLTTLTTVLGLTPLLYESSRQALFLKPTVITLVYGLGFGLVLVLLVVPSLLAVGHDLGRNTRAARRALSGQRAPGLRTALLALGLAMAGWFAATIGSVIAGGALPAFLGGGNEMSWAVGLFTAGIAVLTLLTWALAALGVARR